MPNVLFGPREYYPRVNQLVLTNSNCIRLYSKFDIQYIEPIGTDDATCTSRSVRLAISPINIRWIWFHAEKNCKKKEERLVLDRDKKAKVLSF